jgi:hypothetical protein
MPAAIKAHLRYPQDLFKIQAQIYSTYHMQDPVVYYNREDVWNIPTENYQGSTIEMEPYYIINNLPDEEKAEFILMTPFTPANRNNMVAWMAARNDGEHYGELFTYQFSKDQLVYGPNQIESRIDQESKISQLLSLWSQRGSRVIRGNLLVIPIKNSVIYVEPIFLQAETGGIPELRRVIVAYKSDIVMRDNLAEALQAMFQEEAEQAVPELDNQNLNQDSSQDSILGELSEQQSQENSSAAEAESSALDNLAQSELINRASQTYQRAQQALQNGDFSIYGRLITELGDILDQLTKTGE